MTETAQTAETAESTQTTAAPSAPDDYGAAFRRLIGRSVTLAMEEAAQPGWQPLPEKRAQLLFALSNALRLPAAWAETLPLLAALAPRMEQAGMRAEWLAYVERGIACCDLSGDRRTGALLALERGILFERLGKLAEAQAALTDAIDRFTAAGDRRGAAKAHNRLAYVLRGRRAAGEAAQHVEQAQALLDPADTEVLYCHLVWGMLAADQHDWPAAEQHLRRCADGWGTTGERRLYGMSLINLAVVYIATARYEQAADSLEVAAAVLVAVDDSANEALVHLNLGVTYLFLQRSSEAIGELLLAESVYRQLQDEQRLALVYSNLGLAYAELARLPEAEQYFNAAIRRFQALEDYPSLIDTLIDFARLYLHFHQNEQACKVALQAQSLLDHALPAKTREYQRTKIDDILSAAGLASGEQI